MLHTTNFGANWSTVKPGGSDTVSFNVNSLAGRPLCFVNAATGWVIGELGDPADPRGAVIYSTTNSGSSWTKQLVKGWSNGVAVQFVDANNGWATVVNNPAPNFIWSVVHTTNGGSDWALSHSDSADGKFFDPYFTDPENGWAILDSVAGTPCWILHTTNGGSTWTTQFSQSNTMYGGLCALQFTDTKHGWVVGGGEICHTTDGGTTWSMLPNTGISPSSSTQHALFFLNADTGWIGSQSSTTYPDTSVVLYTTDGGVSWSTEATGIQYGISGLCFVDAKNGWLAGGEGGLCSTTNSGVTTVQEGPARGIADRFELNQNFPNPFNPTTTIRYAIPIRSHVTLRVFNTLGQEVAELVDAEKIAGTYTVTFDAGGLASGVYLYRLETGGFVQTRKLMVIK
ncbi:MAG TPA: YCF48-related protein [Bacteroidota bacterium]|nr:YCF48-related protein [Bacteroidota bacterium]